MSEPNRAGIHGRTFISVANLLVLIGGAFVLSSSPAQATTVAGRTPGTFAVSPTGAATYTIPIWAPPGPNGMQPNIALVYNSQEGGGFPATAPTAATISCNIPPGKWWFAPTCILQPSIQAQGSAYGVGWTLQGLSSIYRCNLTYAQDAAPAPIYLHTSDGYCLDGQRLRLTSGTYGVAGSTYQTEVANFINVTAYGAAGNGPAYWITQDRNGRTYTYGNGGNSQVLATGTPTAVSWQLNEVSDPAGNTMTVSYSTATGSAVPATISWTPASHGSSSYNYTMTFAYGTNVPQSSYYGYTAGTSVQNTNLLSSITIAYTGTTVKKYVLSYQTSPTTGRDELTQVQECSDSAGTNCLLPTVMTYQSGAAGVSTSGTTAVSAHTAGTTVYAHYDLNGDGYPDLIYANAGLWYVAFGSSTGYGTPVSTGISSSTSILPGDLLGNGKDGILANNGGTWYYYTWNGSSFSGASTGLAYDSTSQYVLADINGDGLPDLAKGKKTVANYNVTTYLNVGGGSTVSFGSAVDAYDITNDTALKTATLSSASNGATAWGTLRGFDFNGDGREDLILQIYESQEGVNTYSTYELLSQGSTFLAQYIIDGSSSPPGLAFLNWNNDGCTDFAQPGISLTTWVITISGCNGASAATITINSASIIGAMDWDGDGRTDLLVANGSTIGVYQSTGNGVSTLVTTSVPWSSANVYFTIKPTGDGMDAIGYANSSGPIGYFKHNGGGQPPDLVSSVTDGYGNSASPTYVSLVQNNYTENGYGTPTYPERVWIGPTYVVSTATFSDPSSTGGTYHQNFWYYGGWTSLQGRGFEGFYATDTTDSRNALQDYQYYERSFPATGKKFQDIVSNGTFYPSQWVGTPATTTLSSTQYQQRYFPYFSNVTAYRKEVGGSENGDLITTTSTNYTFDNYGNATTIAKTVTDNDPNSPYLNQTWSTTTTNTPVVNPPLSCTGLFTETQVAYTSSLSGSSPVTRTKTFTPDTINCRYTQIVTEPNSSQFKVTEVLGYDSFGNISSDTITGINMSARQTTLNWGTTGQFPMSLTDPTNAPIQLNYNFSYGLRSSLTDPNNVLTSWQYGDGFGRMTQELRADGTYTNFTYSDCAPSCLIGSHGTQITHQVYAVGGTVITDGTDYQDSVDWS